MELWCFLQVTWMRFVSCVGVLCCLVLQGANPVVRVDIPHAAVAPRLTRNADLSDWGGALLVSDFFPFMPDDQGTAPAQTRVHLLWGPDALYVAFEADDPNPRLLQGNPSARDAIADQDQVSVEIDPTGQGLSAIQLKCNPLGFQSDGLVTEGAFDEDTTYDCQWDSVGVRTATGYVVKMRVPYTSFRRLPGDWGIRLKRLMPRDRFYGMAWPRQSRDVQGALVQMAKAGGAPQEQGRAPVLVIGSLTGNREGSLAKGDLENPTVRGRVGADLRYSGTAFTLDATYRPDFSAVEADIDPLQINSRYKVEYPEKRPFFLEGMELFGGGGYGPRPFFSRSIVEPMYGAKASGHTSRVSWSFLGARDESGGRGMVSDGAVGTEHLQTRDAAAAVRLRLDERGSNITFLGTDRALLGGVEGGGKSGMVAYQQRFGEHLKVRFSGMSGWARLPNGEGTLARRRGTATDWGVDFNSRNWDFWLSGHGVSPDLVLLSGFTNLTGYRSQSLFGGWAERRDASWWTEARVYLSSERMDGWDGTPMSRSHSLEFSMGLAHQVHVEVGVSGGGREYVGTLSQPVHGSNVELSWSELGWFKPYLDASVRWTADLATGLPAVQRSHAAGWRGHLGGLLYQAGWQYRDLDDEVSGSLIVKALQQSLLLEYRFPRWAYVKTQFYNTRYIRTTSRTADTYFRVLAGWQVDAFSQCYVGYARRKAFDPSLDPWRERMTEQGLFAKLAIAFRF